MLEIKKKYMRKSGTQTKNLGTREGSPESRTLSDIELSKS